MKQTGLILLLLLFFHPAACPSPPNGENGAGKALASWQANRAKNVIISAIIYQESRGNHYAYNVQEKAAGLLQIRPIMVREANRIAGYERFKEWQRWDSTASVELFWLVQSRHQTGLDPVKICLLWNTGQKTGKPNAYTKSVLQHMEKLDKGEILN